MNDEAESEPTANGGNGDEDSSSPEETGRDSSGKFTKGNPGGPGNPYNKRVAEFRNVLMNAVTHADLQEIAFTLLEQSKAGNLDATKVLLDRLLGRPTQHNINENLDGLTVQLQMVEEIVDADLEEASTSKLVEVPAE